MIETIGIIAAVILPFWNIPLIARIERRKSSKDISLFWVLGVWICLVFMFPAAIISDDIVFKVFSIVNIILFSLVVIQTLRYR
ncbi:MAG: hypothetical protein ISS45_02985 [Candidatus Omnitrophica bacterium]|nr:hypothetical protein [Candidatus Omnitrophota bacterium]